MIIEPNQTERLQSNPTKSRVEKKDIQTDKTTERIAHSVVNVDDRAVEKR